MNTVYDVSVTVSAELVEARLSIGEILNFSRGTVVEVGRHVATTVKLKANGIPIAHGDIMVKGDRLCVRITDFIDATGPARRS